MKKVKNFILTSVSILFKRVFNLIVQIMLSAFFGTGRIMDAFFIALSIPQFINNVLLYSLKNVLIPKFIEVEKNNNKSNFKSELFILILIISLFISVNIIIFSKQIVSFVAPGVSTETKSLGRYILIASIGLIILEGISHYLMTIFNAWEKYFYISIVPILSGILTITIFYLLQKEFSIYGLLIAWYISLIFQIFVFLKILQQKKIFKKINLKLITISDDIKDTIKLALPLIFSAIFINIISITDKIFASFLPQGAISYLSYAEKLNMAIMIIPFSFMTIFLPDLAKSVINKEDSVIKDKLQKNIIVSLYTIIPIIIFVYYNSHIIVNILFGFGKFEKNSIYHTGNALKFYIYSVLGYNLTVILGNLLYSLKKNGIVAIFYIFNTFLNILLAFILSKYLGYRGIALAFSISYNTLAIIFIIYIQINLIKILDIKIIKQLIKIGVLTVGSILFLNYGFSQIDSFSLNKLENFKVFIVIFSRYILFISIIIYFISYKKINAYVKKVTNV